MEEELESFVDLIHDVLPKETVSCKGLFVLILKAINVTSPCNHLYQEGNFRSEVISGYLHKVSGDVTKLLGRGDYVDVLIQELTRFVLGEPVLAHGDQDLDSNCSLLRVCRPF